MARSRLHCQELVCFWPSLGLLLVFSGYMSAEIGNYRVIEENRDEIRQNWRWETEFRWEKQENLERESCYRERSRERESLEAKANFHIKHA